MLTAVQPIHTYDVAYNNLIQHFENNSAIAEAVQSKIKIFFPVMQSIHNIITNTTIPETVESVVDEHILATLTYFAELAPWLVITYSELEWNEFLSDYVVCITSYDNYLEMQFNYTNNQIFTELQAILRLADLGAGYEALIRAGNMVIAELNLWKDNGHPALSLSKSYLESLGYYDKNKTENQSSGEC